MAEDVQVEEESQEETKIGTAQAEREQRDKEKAEDNRRRQVRQGVISEEEAASEPEAKSTEKPE